jgi:hypothetical protein
MALQDDAQTLLDLRMQLEDLEKRYEDQRLIVRRQLDAAQQSQLELDGFRIAKVDDKIVRRFDLQQLREELRYRYMTDSEIDSIIAYSKEESVQTGVLRITRLPRKEA